MRWFLAKRGYDYYTDYLHMLEKTNRSVLLYTWKSVLLLISYVSSGFLKNPKSTCALSLKQAKLAHKITLWGPRKIDRKLISEQSIFTTGNAKI